MITRVLVAVFVVGVIAGCARSSRTTPGAVPSTPTVSSAPTPSTPPPKESPRQVLARAEALMIAEDYRGASESYTAFLAVHPDDGAAARVRATRTALDRLLATQADVQRLQREATEAQAEIQRLKRDAGTRDGELTRLRKDLTAQQTELDRLKSDLERLKSIDLRPEQRRR